MGLPIRQGIEQVGLGRVRRRQAIEPSRINKDMASAAGAIAAAIGVDAGNILCNRGFHHRYAGGAFHLPGNSVGTDEYDLGHVYAFQKDILRAAARKAVARAVQI